MDGRAKWFFGIDHPRFFPQSIEKYTKAVGVGQGLDLSDEEQLALIEALFERVDKLSAEDPAQGFDWKEKVLTRRDPAVSIKRQRARGNQAVQMKMIQQGLVPGVQNCGDPQAPTQTTARKLRQGLPDRLKQDIDERFLVDQDQRVQFVRQGKDQMKISGRQQF